MDLVINDAALLLKTGYLPHIWHFCHARGYQSLFEPIAFAVQIAKNRFGHRSSPVIEIVNCANHIMDQNRPWHRKWPAERGRPASRGYQTPTMRGWHV